MKKPYFTFSRRNQKGQVAIFVALIFQVIFVFFAVLINIGLLVHQKINLQQSADLSAYYGAMKQAEIMNMISHVNFQMRQAWKLLTWRYRIVGTFAFQEAKEGAPLTFPLNIPLGGGPATIPNPSAVESAQCAVGINILDVPFFCVGHAGLLGWPNGAENQCRVNCGHLADAAREIPAVPKTGGYDTQFTGGVSGQVNASIDQANQNIAHICADLGPKGFNVLAKYILAYGEEVANKKKLIQMLGANLSADVDTAIDLEGGLIKTGSQKTFDNNLTEANLTGKISFNTLNGLRASSSGCAFKGDASDGQENSKQFLAEIKLQAIQYFIHQCTGGRDDGKQFVPLSIFTDSTFSTIRSNFLGTLSGADVAQITNALRNIEYILGYEKNPWCQVYYGVKAQTEPKIPFLPLAKVRLSAIAFAKPFGGTIGPRYFANWSPGSPVSDSGDKVDANLPVKKFSGIPPAVSSFVAMGFLLPNYSNFVGDKKGLRDAATVATYQDILLHRQLTQSVVGASPISQNKTNDVAASSSGITQPSHWPSYTSWNNLNNPNTPTYDYIAADNEPSIKNSFLRDLELSVVAPNQFDVTYYSIDPDFYNNYYLKIKSGTAGTLTFAGSYSKMFSIANNGPTIDNIHPDYGYNQTLENNNAIAKGFSVRHQSAIAQQVVKKAPRVATGPVPTIEQTLNFVAALPSSYLTGWTFLDFSSYSNFPAPTNMASKMYFGRCGDPDWNDTPTNLSNISSGDLDRTYGSPVAKNLPPTPGNCVTGGRTGYSVKIVSPSLLRVGAPALPYGGGASSGNILNPIDEDFFTF